MFCVDKMRRERKIWKKNKKLEQVREKAKWAKKQREAKKWQVQCSSGEHWNKAKKNSTVKNLQYWERRDKKVEFCLKDFCSLCYFGRIGSCSRDTYKSLGNWDSYYFIWGERVIVYWNKKKMWRIIWVGVGVLVIIFWRGLSLITIYTKNKIK